jgi:hypothetical protein
MMQGADVVQAIFRTLGIDGWETAGMEPADAAIPTRPWDSDAECPGSTEHHGLDRDSALDGNRAGASGEPEMEIVLAPCFADDGTG